jgi:hypothetical protein
MTYLYEFSKKEPQQFGEVISCITGMYSFSRTITLKTYITEIASSEDIPILYRLECAKQLQEEGYPIINKLCYNMLFKFLPTPIRVEAVIYIMKIMMFKEDGLVHFCEIINDIHIETLYRFKLIQRLEKDFQEELFYFYANESSRQFIESRYNELYYRILCCQYVFRKCEEYLHVYSNDFLLRDVTLETVILVEASIKL